MKEVKVKVINFANAKDNPSVLVVNPDFKIRGKTVEISYMSSPSPMFRVRIACRNATVSPDNVDKMIKEINLEPIKSIEVDVIVSKGAAPKTKSPTLKAITSDWFISKDHKAFDAQTHEIKKFSKKERNQWFFKSQSYNKIVSFQGYDLSIEDVSKTKKILNKIKKYFDQIND